MARSGVLRSMLHQRRAGAAGLTVRERIQHDRERFGPGQSLGDKSVFTIEQTHGRALRAGNELISHSPEAGWRSLYAATFREAPLRTRESAIGHPSLIYHLARPTTVVRQLEGQGRESATIGPGRFCLTPGEASAYWQHSGNPQILQLYLRRSVYESAVEEMYGGSASLVPRFAIVDPLLEQLAIAVLNALQDGNAEDRLYIETIAQLIGVHLARAHSTRSRPRAGPPADGLTQARIRRLIDYIEQHLGEDLSLHAMATELDLSPLYLARAFRSAMGLSPHQYVVSRRVECARRLLSDTNTPIAEIALAAGFSSQSHLSNWFRRIVGVSPAVYRRRH
jgi:AraC family transcriptional regulator